MCVLVSVNHLNIVTAACRVLLKYLIGALLAVSREGRTNTVHTERCLRAIRALCAGSNLLTKSELNILANTMKGETAPTHPATSGNYINKQITHFVNNVKNNYLIYNQNR